MSMDLSLVYLIAWNLILYQEMWRDSYMVIPDRSLDLERSLIVQQYHSNSSSARVGGAGLGDWLRCMTTFKPGTNRNPRSLLSKGIGEEYSIFFLCTIKYNYRFPLPNLFLKIHRHIDDGIWSLSIFYGIGQSINRKGDGKLTGTDPHHTSQWCCLQIH